MEKQKKRLLVVEDAPYMSEMIKDMLDPEEYEIVGCVFHNQYSLFLLFHFSPFLFL